MLPVSASTAEKPASTAARCRYRYAPAASEPTMSTGASSRRTRTGPTAVSPSRSASKAARGTHHMNWLEGGIDGPLVAVRAIHFAATAITTGTLVFRALVV